MSEYFVFTRETPLYLYGAASIGKIVFEKNPFLNIRGFLDARAEEIKEFKGLPVYTIEQAREQIAEEDAVIMLSVKNVFEHEDIAAELCSAGFDKLVYKSRAVLEGKGTEDEEALSEIWDSMISGCYTGSTKRRMCFRDIIKFSFEDQAIIKSGNGEVLAYIPVELIYTNNRNDKWSDLNIQGYYPHMYFFYFLENHKNGQFEDYMRFVEEGAREQGDIKITDAWKENVLRNRTLVYENMRFNLDVDPDFFRRNAATAVWNEKGYFNLTSGKHRCAFLVSQGYRYIALKIAAEDYNKYLAFEDVDSVCEEIKREKLRWTKKHIYHPWFYRFPCKEEKFYSIFQIEILCRVIRLSDQLRRNVTVWTNLPRENSLYRILEQCRRVQFVESSGRDLADIVLIDDFQECDSMFGKVEGVCWHIGKKISGNTIAEYYSTVGKVAFYTDNSSK